MHSSLTSNFSRALIEFILIGESSVESPDSASSVTNPGYPGSPPEQQSMTKPPIRVADAAARTRSKKNLRLRGKVREADR
jgi:hypothetical protein